MPKPEPEPELKLDDRVEAQRFLALPPERKAAELNRMSKRAGLSDVYVVIGGEVVRKGTVNYERAHKAMRRASRPGRLAGIARPFVRLRERGRARRGRRTTPRRSQAASSARREPEPPPSLELEAAS